MGISGISPLSLILILAIVILLFGTKRLKTMGHDLGTALKSFRKGLESHDSDENQDKS